MKVKRLDIKKLFTYFSVIFSLSLASFFIFALVDGRNSLAEVDEGWDGVSVSQEFRAGNGTVENPYVISSPEDFIYFKNLIEGENYKSYQDKYYKLDQDINLGEKEITSIGLFGDVEDKLFIGHLNGDGHKIYNFKIVEANNINDTNYYSLFTSFSSGSLENISFDDFLIEVSSENSYTSLLGSIKNTDEELNDGEIIDENNTEDNNTDNQEINNQEKLIIKNVSFNHFVINTGNSEHNVSLLMNSISSNTEIINCSFVGSIVGDKSSTYLSTNNNGNIDNILYKINSTGELKIDNTGINNLFYIKDDVIYLNDEVIESSKLLSTFNEELDSKYYYDYVDGVLKLLEYVEPTKSIDDQEYSFDFSIRGSADITLHDSGVDAGAKTVYVNDLTSDYNYYRGLNYTTSSNGSIPTGVNRNLYNDTTLAKIYIAYKGSSINSSSTDVGYVSLDEQYSDIIYYKYYPIEGGYVTIPLIDNPYADRPNDKAFNGWVTDYPGAVVSLDTDTYTRYVKIPAPSTPSNATSITMYASWTEATAVVASVSSGELDTDGLNSISMIPVFKRIPIYDGVTIPDLYTYESISSGTGRNGVAYPSGAVNSSGQSLNNSRCQRNNNGSARTCYYYMPVDESDIDYSSTSYYYLRNGNMTSYTFPTPTGYNDSTFLSDGDNVTGYFKKGIPAGSLNGYYNGTGVLQTSGTCSGTTCDNYYELLQYSSDTDHIFNIDTNHDFYYLVTRDTNIAYLTANINGFENDKPVTVTGLNNGSNRSNYRINVNSASVDTGADLRIEWCNLYTGTIEEPATSGPSNSTTNYIYGNFYNLKIGRGITLTEGTYNAGSYYNPNYVDSYYFNARGVVGGGSSSTGSSGSPTKYSFIVESGYYNYLSSVSTVSSSATYYVRGIATFGNDIDRIRNDNDSMGVGYNLASSYGGTVSSGSYVDNFIVNTVKSGTYGIVSDDTASGIYAGGLNGGTISSPAELNIEGGKVLYVNGGPLISTNLTNYNAIYIYLKGGEVSAIYGGAARSETYGNRIIGITGGTVNYSVFGGSNGIEGSNSSNSRGTLNGSTFIRIGGNSVIGTESDTVFGAEAGSVFGAGNGRNGYTEIGSVNNSYVLIQDESTINGNVYGGGNYGSVKAQSGRTSTTTITVDGGNVKGSIYGGGNNNGSGSTTITSTININVNNGTVDGSVYGGSCTKGIVYGTTNVTVNGGVVKTDVYGGGEGGYTNSNNPGTYVRDDVNVTINNGTINGSVYGGSAFGSVNTINENTTSSTASTTVTVNGGTITTNVFGGAKGSSDYTPKVIGDITVNINGGSSGKVFGGFDASGKPNALDEVYLNGGTVGDAFGGGNNANQDVTNIYLQGSTITGNLYGGSNLLGTVSESNVTVTSGSVTDIYGGNNLDGTTVDTNVLVSGTGCTITGDIYGGGNEAPSTTTEVTITNSQVNDVYGGCKKANVTSTDVTVNNTTGKKVFGGSNESGVVGNTDVKVTGSTLTSAYGGNNQGGNANNTNVVITTSQITDVYGGGDNAESGISNVLINSGTITNVYGGGNDAGLTTSNIAVKGGTITDVYGGSNNTGDITDSYINVGPENIGVKVDYTKSAPDASLNSDKPTYSEITVTVTNYTDQTINDWEVELNIPQATLYDNGSNSNVTINANSNTVNVNSRRKNNNNAYNSLQPYGSYTFTFSVLSDSLLDNFQVTADEVRPTTSGTSNISITNLYGGNNKGGVTTNTHIKADKGNITTIYGGGNVANVGSTNVVVNEGVTSANVYGGGNAAGVNGDTLLDINGTTITGNVYGGGDEGIVKGNSNVFISDGTIGGNAFAGGNGASAVVHKNSTITIDGSTEVGTSSSVVPNSGCVFGSGNAAATGFQVTNISVGTVNIVGGIIHGNVYGGPKMSVVYGVTDTNIGTDSVNNSNLVEDDIIISGTVFGGGESNSEGGQAYDYTFISVTQGIDVNINGNNYITNNHEFIINGSIFGSGNASSSSGESNIYIKDLGTLEKPNKSISIQRASNLVVDHSVIELSGTTDRTNEYSDILYSLNLIDKLTVKNSNTLLLHHTSNMLMEYYSGYDDPQQGLVPAVVTIDEENKTVTKNTDNRIYMVPGENLHVATNQNATEFGKVTGMTFFGMYVPNENGTYRFGLYDNDLDYGDPGNASLEIIGGSYVLGLHHNNHDITVDGFYSNYIDEEAEEVKVDYIDPDEIGSTGYRWTIGFEAINYEVELIAAKYSSLGAKELQLMDFGRGNTLFSILGVDTSGLNTGLSLVDSDDVPRLGVDETEANSVFGLSMKAETQEWTGYGTTKYLDTNGGEVIGVEEYLTDSRAIAPSLMFYLYHAKNMSCTGPLGEVVITVRADVPKNQFEFDITYLTITVRITAMDIDEDSYDAAITYDKRYEMPSTTTVNITNQSQFSTYYSLITWKDRLEDIYGAGNNYFHTLVSSYALPVNTMITMLDFGANDARPEYYYFKVDQAVYNDSLDQLSQYHEVTYPLSRFIKMDSTSPGNHYVDAVENLKYYDASSKLVDEEFMFIFDFKQTTQTGDHLNNSMLFELRNTENRTIYNVFGIREPLMTYSTYESSNVVLEQTITENEQYLYYNIADEFNYYTEIQYDETETRLSVIDTNYESSKMGLNVQLFDRNGDPVSSSLLIGSSIYLDRTEHFCDADGVFRIKLANKVSNLIKYPTFTVTSELPVGEYTMVYTLFASDDGLHNSNPRYSVESRFTVHVVSNDNAIIAEVDDNYKLVDGETGLNMEGTNVNTYDVSYEAELSNPNVRIEVLKRDTDSVTATTFTPVLLSTVFKEALTRDSNFSYYLNMEGETTKSFDLTLVDPEDMTSGTYQIKFKLYDNDQVVDEDIKYLIIKKKSVE